MTRLFVAVLPDERVVEALRRLSGHDRPDVRGVPEANWHVTLRFIGEADPAATIDLLSGVALLATHAALGPSLVRLGRRQIVAPVAGVDGLAAAVRTATSPVGAVDPRLFFGHLTIARTKPDAPSSIEGAAIEADWTVSEIALVESELRPTGAVHTTVATFPLSGSADPRPG